MEETRLQVIFGMVLAQGWRVKEEARKTKLRTVGLPRPRFVRLD